MRADARFFGLVALVLAAAFLRLVPHPAGFAPIAALALFGSAHFSRRWIAIVLPMLALFLSDAVIGFHEQMPAVYLSFVLVALLGFVFVRDNQSAARVAGTSVLGSLVFFVVTNFAVWAQTAMYAKSFEGLVACYVAAIPFLKNSLVGDLMFNGVLFGAWYALVKWFPSGLASGETKAN